ncbi:uncharacterized protein LOC135348431 isoform X2 [Halichondria panicea]|uniref:uncharacterized protein LOC135348431 isoform X2 n=1 Tax=Halichondria panicea TaxID=6063 RepID=UPI00312BBE84
MMCFKLLPFLCMVCAVVGDYELRVRVHSYLNADSRCATCTRSLVNPIYGCCDNQTNTGVCSGDELCDTFFIYCLRSLGEMGIRCPVNNVTAFFSRNTDMLLDIGDTVLGSENPFLYSGPIWTGFQFYLMAKDSGMPDGVGVGSKDIDSFAIDLNIDGGQRLEPQVFQGRFGIAEIELSFDLICTDSYSLPNCMSCDPGTSDLCTQRGTALIAPPTLHTPTHPPPSDGAVVGGILGAITIVALIAIATVALIVAYKILTRRLTDYDLEGTVKFLGPPTPVAPLTLRPPTIVTPLGDNPVYAATETRPNGIISVAIAMDVAIDDEREFDNPLYGDNGVDGLMNKGAGTLTDSDYSTPYTQYTMSTSLPNQ